MFDPFYVKLKL